MSHSTPVCYRCGDYGHLSVDCPNYAAGSVTTRAPAPHEQHFVLDLNHNPRMACEDCDWSARGEAGWLACQALVHLSQHPEHRLEYSEPCGLTATVTGGQLPRYSGGGSSQ